VRQFGDGVTFYRDGAPGESYLMQLKPSDDPGAELIKAFTMLLLMVLVFFLCFLTGWRHVFPENLIHRSYDAAVRGIAAFIRHVLKLAGFKKKGKLKLGVNATALKQSVQAAKIYFGNFQVLSSFVSFKVTLPPLLQGCLYYLNSFAQVFALDVFRWPGMGCLTQLDYTSKLLMSTLLPLLIVLFLVMPVVASWLRLRYLKLKAVVRRAVVADSGQGSRKDKSLILTAMTNFDKTATICWNNILTWLFLVFPSTTLSALQTFNCRRIGNAKYLAADLSVQCEPSTLEYETVLGYSIFATMIWAVGIPVFTITIMMRHGVRHMAYRKRKSAIVSAMIDRFRDDTVDSNVQTLASFVGKLVRENGEDKIDAHFEDRCNHLFENIFPDHAFCESCAGHSLPKWPAFILNKLLAICYEEGFDSVQLQDPVALKKAIYFWFRSIDFNLDDEISTDELREEFVSLGWLEAQADFMMKNFDANEDGVLNLKEFEGALLYVLDNSVPGLRAMEVVALLTCFLEAAGDKVLPAVFEMMDLNSDGKISREEFVSQWVKMKESDPYEVMDRLDIDKDGTLSLKELRAGLIQEGYISLKEQTLRPKDFCEIVKKICHNAFDFTGWVNHSCFSRHFAF